MRKTKPEPRAKRKPAMEHKSHAKPHAKSDVKPDVKVEVKPPPPPPVAAPAPKVEAKPVGPNLDDATLEECARIVESYISRNTTQHTPRDLLAYEIAAAIRTKKGS